MAKPIPFAFVLDELETTGYRTRKMFGATAVYIEEKIVLILWEKNDSLDSGVWIATSREYHESLKKDFPSMHSISVLGEAPTNWQVLPANAPDFEEAVYKVCELVRKGDPRIGKIPARKKKAARTAPRSRGISDKKKLPHPGRDSRRVRKKEGVKK